MMMTSRKKNFLNLLYFESNPKILQKSALENNSIIDNNSML